jgi:hypothetical protein
MRQWDLILWFAKELRLRFPTNNIGIFRTGITPAVSKKELI